MGELVVSPDEAKDLLKIQGVSLDNDVLPSYLRAAQTAIEDRVGPLTPTTVVQQASVTGGQLLLGTVPVLSVTSVSSTLSASYPTPTVTAAGVVCWPTGGGPSAGARCTVTYVAGRADCPDNLRQAVVEMLRWLMRGYRASRPGPNGGTPPQMPMKAGLPAVVESLISSSRTAGFA